MVLEIVRIESFGNQSLLMDNLLIAKDLDFKRLLREAVIVSRNKGQASCFKDQYGRRINLRFEP